MANRTGESILPHSAPDKVREEKVEELLSFLVCVFPKYFTYVYNYDIDIPAG